MHGYYWVVRSSEKIRNNTIAARFKLEAHMWGIELLGAKKICPSAIFSSGNTEKKIT